MRCPPSMVAAGCIGAAAVGYRGLQWCNDVRLMVQLHTITHIEVVSTPEMYHFVHSNSCI